MFDVRLVGFCLGFLYWAALGYIEKQQFWTLRLKLSCWSNGWVVLTFWVLVCMKTILDLVAIYDIDWIGVRVAVSLITSLCGWLCFAGFLPLAQSRTYLELRWKAWTGASRTGIAPRLVKYLSNKDEWRTLNSQLNGLNYHRVESFAWLYNMFNGGITADPTELLNRQFQLDEETGTLWIPRSEIKEGIYAPVEADAAASLLWGVELGFARRCSRGIIAVPNNLLAFSPRLKNGVDGRPVCLAHGILARNKGLQPHLLVCGLQNSQSRRHFEENSSLWPMPSKTSQTFYHDEMKKSYAGLGTDFVAASTWLALLLADSKPLLIMDWLDAQLEQQDLKLNNQAAVLGASSEDLLRLYRGQYIAKLVSLSEHTLGTRVRPELMVFKALLMRDGVQDWPRWLTDSSMVARLDEESRMLGERGVLLIEAALS